MNLWGKVGKHLTALGFTTQGERALAHLDTFEGVRTAPVASESILLDLSDEEYIAAGLAAAERYANGG